MRANSWIGGLRALGFIKRTRPSNARKSPRYILSETFEELNAFLPEPERRLGHMPIEHLLKEVQDVFPNATEVA